MPGLLVWRFSFILDWGGAQSKGYTLDCMLELSGGFMYICIKMGYSKGVKLGHTFELLVYVKHLAQSLIHIYKALKK